MGYSAYDKHGNRIHVDVDGGVDITPKDKSTMMYNLKDIIDATEKQIAKKPITYKGTNRADCSTCGATVRGIDKPFGDWCSKCGQKLDWGK